MRPRTPAVGYGLALALTFGTTVAVSGATDSSEAQQYCSDKGGNVVELKPTLYPGTDQQVELGGSLEVCQFISQDGDSPTQLVVDLTTLHSEKPTLAGLAYLSKVPSSNGGAAGSNPAASYCPADVGGTEQFGTAAAGSWVGALDPGMEAGDAEPLGDTITLCVFADRSAIDEFALFYASDGTVRGVDLSTVMRYQLSEDSPAIFGAGS
jgi:putative hemolysin